MGDKYKDFLDIKEYEKRIVKPKKYTLRGTVASSTAGGMNYNFYKPEPIKEAKTIMKEFDILTFEKKKRIELVAEVSNLFKSCLEKIDSIPFKKDAMVNDITIEKMMQKARDKAYRFYITYGLSYDESKYYPDWGPARNESYTNYWEKKFKPTIDELIQDYNFKQITENRRARSDLIFVAETLKRNNEITTYSIHEEDKENIRFEI